MLKRKPILLSVLLLILFSSCQKQSTESKPASQPAGKPASATGPPGFPPPVLNKPYPGTGVVATINRDEGWIEINHEEIKGFMSAMEMSYLVNPQSLLNGLTTGDKIRFTIDPARSTVTSIDVIESMNAK